MFPASALYGKPASGKAGTWQTFLLISTRSCGACWVKNWGELAPVSIIKKTRAEKMASICFHCSLCRPPGRNNLFSLTET